MDAGEDAGDAARREFMEELGSAPVGPLQPLGEIRQRGGKRVHAFAVNGDLDVQTVASTSKWNRRRKAGGCRRFRRSSGPSGLHYR
jgi:predicted NUDIX family NTP pyrophosphohydrolase